MYTRSEVVAKASELAKMIAETEEVELFKKAEEKVNSNDKLQTLISRIKFLQKEAVNLQHYQKHEALKQVDEKIDALMGEVDSIPVVQDFKQSQVEVNDLLQLVTHTISNTVTNEVIKATGGNLLRGTTGAAEKRQNSDGCGCS
jgi:cell fate (sporulation/competence/biofilm development) regulator YmcA (YheA/YmcA/DUF963 family)